MASPELFPALLGSDSKVSNNDDEVAQLLRLILVWHPYKSSATFV